jgi:hypothetical protein
MIIAEVGGRIVVRGSRIAMPEEGPMPGSTPIRVPMKHPMVAHMRFVGVRADMKPWSR